jgi:chemotaxis family two-component system sensor kinase Cph1
MAELPIISCSPSDMAQVFQNLISNAVKYCPCRPEIRITAERGPDAWVFSVRDNGIGIDAVDREKIFEMFTRLHTDAYPGTGAGLAICKAIIEKHGGSIWVESEKGHGSTFFFTIPF